MRLQHALSAGLVFCLASASAEDWPQFRGHGASGVARQAPAGKYPDELRREAALWSVPLAPGISSPCVIGDRIYVTGFAGGKLLTIALERSTGKVLWEKAAPADRIEETHAIGSPATPTPASDGDRTYVFFGSYGLLAYDRAGEVVWRKPLGPFKNNYGQASSPVIAGDRLLLNCDQDIDSFLLCVRKDTGETVWRAPRPGFPRGFSTPIPWDGEGGPQVLVAGTLRLIAYGLDDGKERWSVSGLARIVNSTPVIGDGLLFVQSYAPGGDGDERISMDDFGEVLKSQDADRNGLLEIGEVPEGPFRSRYPQIDSDKDGHITRGEWESMRRIFEAARNAIFAVRPGGSGDVTGSRVMWRFEKLIPYVPSPLYLDGRVYMVKDGAIFTCLDARTGRAEKTARLPAPGNYYASPVAAADRIYLVSQGGEACVVRAGPAWEVISHSDLGETCMATPALADGRIYLRTDKQLHCFGR